MTIDSYFIKFIDNEISVFSNNNGEFEILKKNGEEVQDFHSDIFWKWFKTKIEYKNEFLSFVIFTDKDSFMVDDKIKIADKNIFLNSKRLMKKIQEQSQGLNIISFPKIYDLKISINTSLNKKTTKREKLVLDNKNIASYFRNETESYRND